MSVPGESYEQWLERTAPARVKRSTDARLWDVMIILLLGVYFAWVGGSSAFIGLGVVAVLLVEQVLRFLAVRRDGPAALTSRRFIVVRGAALMVTLALGVWFALVEGGVAVVLPLVMLLDDLKNSRSSLRWTFERRRNGRADRSP